MRWILLGEFESADACARAASDVRSIGFSALDAYMPYPDKNVEKALGLAPSTLPRWVLLFGLVGAAIGYGILWWTQNVDYPLNVGGHPTHAVPAYVPITFETTVLFASFAAFFGMLRLCRLPRLWHPAFELEGFERASIDRFFLVVDLVDRAEGEDSLRQRLEGLGALRVVRLPIGKEDT